MPTLETARKSGDVRDLEDAIGEYTQSIQDQLSVVKVEEREMLALAASRVRSAGSGSGGAENNGGAESVRNAIAQERERDRQAAQLAHVLSKKKHSLSAAMTSPLLKATQRMLEDHSHRVAPLLRPLRAALREERVPDVAVWTQRAMESHNEKWMRRDVHTAQLWLKQAQTASWDVKETLAQLQLLSCSAANKHSALGNSNGGQDTNAVQQHKVTLLKALLERHEGKGLPARITSVLLGSSGSSNNRAGRSSSAQQSSHDQVGQEECSIDQQGGKSRSTSRSQASSSSQPLAVIPAAQSNKGRGTRTNTTMPARSAAAAGEEDHIASRGSPEDRTETDESQNRETEEEECHQHPKRIHDVNPTAPVPRAKLGMAEAVRALEIQGRRQLLHQERAARVALFRSLIRMQASFYDCEPHQDEEEEYLDKEEVGSLRTASSSVNTATASSAGCYPNKGTGEEAAKGSNRRTKDKKKSNMSLLATVLKVACVTGEPDLNTALGLPSSPTLSSPTTKVAANPTGLVGDTQRGGFSSDIVVTSAQSAPQITEALPTPPPRRDFIMEIHYLEVDAETDARSAIEKAQLAESCNPLQLEGQDFGGIAHRLSRMHHNSLRLFKSLDQDEGAGRVAVRTAEVMAHQGTLVPMLQVVTQWRRTLLKLGAIEEAETHVRVAEESTCLRMLHRTCEHNNPATSRAAMYHHSQQQLSASSPPGQTPPRALEQLLAAPSPSPHPQTGKHVTFSPPQQGRGLSDGAVGATNLNQVRHFAFPAPVTPSQSAQSPPPASTPGPLPPQATTATPSGGSTPMGTFAALLAASRGGAGVDAGASASHSSPLSFSALASPGLLQRPSPTATARCAAEGRLGDGGEPTNTDSRRSSGSTTALEEVLRKSS